ncbi:ankyrin [Leucogyrophana mollusca]|uniref:Ankyrin n=1 Tax=Leucogyrophana mollusca TaxID=85980 RepID=A0ACB8B533_9AGAM|nr:ankyrin [Leucogyrophana mollusca]
MTVLLLAHGAEVTITEAELSRAQSTTQGGPISLSACSPILQTAAARYNDVAALLIRVGADINDGSHPRGSYSNNQTILDFVRGTGGNRLALPSSQAQPSVVSPPNSVPQSGRQPQPDSVWREQYGRLENALKLVDNARNTLKQLDPRQQPDARGYLSELEQLLVIQGAKTSSELRSPFTAAPGQFNHAQPQPANPFLHMQLLQAAQAPQPAAPQPSAPQLLAPQPPAPPAPIPHATFPHTQLTQALPAQGLFPQAPFAYPAFPYLRSGWMGYNNLPPPHSHGFRLIGNDAIHDYTNSWIVPCEDDVPRYSRLFDACFTGDDLTVVELCCTPNNAGAVPLQIAAAHLHDYMRISNLGYSTLYVAILGRQWGTARLIMDVAAEQYERSAERRAVTPNFGSNIESNDWPDTPDAESDVSADANNTDKRPDKNAGPVPSTLKISVSPRTLLYETLANIITSGKRIIAVNVLAKAILDNDVEAFKHIADLYNAPSLPLGTTALESILERDCPEMLDVYLKLTGVGINLVDGKQDNTKEDRFVGGEKPYCGLTVHGTKRKMLTRMEARNPYNRKASSDTPLVWKAASSGALKVLEYLFGEQVLSAYQSYATANYGGANNETKNAVDLRAALQEWLGWEVTELNESPVMAALVNKDPKCILPTLEKLYALSPGLVDSAVNQPLYYSGHNSLLLAVHLGCGTDVIDFLLARGASYMERHRVEGWNVMHLACLTGNGRLLKHLMNKLPEDSVNSLLLQRSKDELETPLHAAVRSYEDDCVAILAAHGGPSLLARDIHGHMPLHSAAHRGYMAIAQTLADVLPDEALHAEDGFGETPLEISTRQALLFRTRQHSPQYLAHPIPTSRLSPPSSPPSLSERQAAVSSLTAIVDELVRDGHLDPATKPGTEILAFADEMKAKLALLESRPRTDASAEGGGGGEHPYSTVIRVGYAAGTLDVVSRAVEARPASRTLVPMRDAMRSVRGTLRYSSKLVARAAEGWAYGPAPRDPGPLVAGLEAKSGKDDPRAKWEAGMVGTRLELSRNLGTGPLTFRYVSRTSF